MAQRRFVGRVAAVLACSIWLSLAPLTSLEHGGIDATVVPHSNNAVGAGRGMRIFADLAKVIKEFPDGTVVMKRNLDAKERGAPD